MKRDRGENGEEQEDEEEGDERRMPGEAKGKDLRLGGSPWGPPR